MYKKCKYNISCNRYSCKYLHDYSYDKRIHVKDIIHMNYIENKDNLEECIHGILCKTIDCSKYHKVSWDVRMDIKNILDQDDMDELHVN
jgi:hypothetical protein